MSAKRSTASVPDPATLAPEVKCSHCPGSRCCTYVTQAIDTPRKMADFDILLWQLAHRNVEIYQDEDGWYLTFLTPCRFLQADGRCGIYESRPQICRDHSNDYCEFDADPADDFRHYFRSYEELDAYCRERFRNWDRRFEKWAKKKGR